MSSTRICQVSDSEITLEVQLTPDPEGPVVKDNAADLMVLYTECSRPPTTLEESYENFRNQLSLRWKAEVTKATTYLVVEAIVELTEKAKKKFIQELS